MQQNDTQPLIEDPKLSEEQQAELLKAANVGWYEQEMIKYQNAVYGVSPIKVAEQLLTAENTGWQGNILASHQEGDVKVLDNIQIHSASQVSDPLPELKFSEATLHVHGPFTFLLNQNHNALRGCQSCGASWVGVMAGDEDSIRWHQVQEPPEVEE